VVFVSAEEQFRGFISIQGRAKVIDVFGLPFGEDGATKTNRDLGSAERLRYLPWMNFAGPHH
jgi:hypothetical protein